jgi:hypothetical protein
VLAQATFSILKGGGIAVAMPDATIDTG